MKKVMNKISVIILIITIISQMLPLAAFADITNSNNHILEIDNNYVLVRIKNDDGRFVIKTKEGSLLRQNDNDKNLLFGEEEPETSYTTFRIDGEDYIYGNNYGFLNLDSQFFQESQNNQNPKTNSSKWKIKDIEITQHLEIVDDPKNPNIGNVKISYEVINKGNKSSDIGSRMLLDTMLGDNDGAPIILGSDHLGVYYEKEILENDIPQYFRAMDDSFSPSIVGYGFIDGWGNIKPNKMIIGHYEGLSSSKWDYNINENLNFTDKSNIYGGEDSAVALYWNPITIGPNETKVFETYYGIGDIAKNNEDIDFNVNLYSINKLTVNDENDGYEEGTIKIIGEIDNVVDNATSLEDVQVSLILDEGLELESREVPYRNIPMIKANNQNGFEFKIKAKPQDDYRVLKYRIDIVAKGLTEPISFSKSILAPGIKGLPPEIQFQSVAPSTLYYEGDKTFTIEGKGYNAYSDKSLWTMELINNLTSEHITIDEEYIIVNDNNITINYPDDLDIGEYELHINYKSDDVENQIVPYHIIISDDVKYRTKAYGILGIIKTVDISSDDVATGFKYNIVTFNSEGSLEDYQNQIDNANTPDTSTIKKSLMIIKGSVLELNTDNTKKYIINSNNNPIVINGIIQYKGEPINILENEDGVTLNGNGTLKLIDGFSFWKWGFETKLSNDKDYSLKAKSAENIENITDENLNLLIEKDIEYLYLKDKKRDIQKNVEINFLGKGTVVKNIGGLLLQIGNAILKEDGISFNGEMALSFIPQDKKSDKKNKTPFDFSAEIEDVLFEKDGEGKSKFKGIDTTLEISMPENMIGGIFENGNVGMLKINTIDNVYTLEGDVSIKVIECHGLFTIMYKNDKLYLDDLEFRIKKEGKAKTFKIPLGSPMIKLNAIGGGINDLYGTLSGDKTAPPLKILLMAGFELVNDNIFEGTAKLTISKLGLKLEGGLELVPIDAKVLKNFYIDARWADPWYLDAAAEIDIIDIVKGSANIYISGQWFEGSVKAVIQVPRSVPIVGGMNFGNIEMGLSSEKVWGSVGVEIWVPIIGNKKLGIGCAYYWDGGFKVTDKNNTLYKPNALYEETILDEDNKPITMLVGTNITKLGDSNNNVMLASNSPSLYRPAVYASIDKNVHYFNVYNQDVAIFQLDYEGDVPDMKLYKPDGTEYLLTNESGEKAYIIQEYEADINKKHIYIFVPEAGDGVWKLESSKSAESTLLNLDQPPTLESTLALGIDEDNDDNFDKIKATWESNNDEEAFIKLSLTSNKDEAGVLIKSNIDATIKEYTFDIPKGITPGNYYVKTEIIKGDYGYQPMYSEPIVITDRYNIPEINENNINVDLAGNGIIEVSFDELTDENISGYYIEMFDELENKIDKAGEYFVNKGESIALIGGQYKTQEILDDNGEVILEEETFGLEVNKTYKIGITTLVEEDNISYLSDIVYSDSIYLPIPNPAVIELEMQNDYKIIKDENDEDIQIIKDDEVLLNFSSDQIVDTKVKINEYTYENFNGKEKQISIPVEDGDYVIEFISRNNNKDTSIRIINFRVDTTSPLLLIEDIKKEQGKIKVKGLSEGEVTLTINGEEIDINNDGIFEHAISMDDVMKKVISIEATDKAGNVSLHETEILNSDVQTIEKVYINPQSRSIQNLMSYQFQLIGATSNGEEIILNNDMVKWSLLKGDTLVDFTEEGLLNAYNEGEIIIKGSYYISSDYAFEDALSIDITKNDVLENVQGVSIRPEIESICIDETQVFEVVGLDENDNEILLDKTKVKWSIIKGNDLADISSEGLLKANNTGTIEIKGRFKFGTKLDFEDTIEINIEKIKSNKDKIDSALRRILDSIIAREKNIIVLKTIGIKSNQNNIIRANNYLTVYIPKGSIDKDDAIMIGKVKDNDKYVYLKGLENSNIIGDIYELQFAKSNQNLDKPMILKFKLDDSKIDNKDNIGVYYYNEKYGKWEYIEGEISNNEISIEINHFSKYAVLEKDNLNISDIDGRWSEVYIKKLISLGILNGIEKEGIKYIEPKRYITRLELAAMVSRTMNLSDNNDTIPPFVDWDDIPHWGKTYAKTAYDNNWINGKTYNNGKVFAPKDYATRAEVVAVIGRLIETENIDESSFTDNNQIPSWAKVHVNKLVFHNIISGYNDGTFKPNNNITREEVSKILSVFIENEFNK